MITTASEAAASCEMFVSIVSNMERDELMVHNTVLGIFILALDLTRP